MGGSGARQLKKEKQEGEAKAISPMNDITC